MKGSRSYIAVGLALIALGIVFLLQNFDMLTGIENLVLVALFAIVGLVFLAVFASNREQWWALIPGCSLLGIAALIGFEESLGNLAVSVFFLLIGLSFWLIYAVRRDFWWAIIPGGVLFSLSLMLAFEDSLPGEAAPGILFLGLGVTFGLVYLLPKQPTQMRWALIPAAILAIMGLLFLMSLGGLTNIVLAAVLIVVGGFVIVRTLRKR